MKTAREIHKGNKNRLNLPLHKLFGSVFSVHTSSMFHFYALLSDGSVPS